MRRVMVVAALVGLLAAPAGASMFVNWSFDQVVDHSQLVVRGTVDRTWSSWDANHEIIFTYAELSTEKYFMGNGAPKIVVREVGGTVGSYSQVAVGFPELRNGESVVLFLSQADDESVYQIEAYNQGKYLIQHDGQGREVLVQDTHTQGVDPKEPMDDVVMASPAAGLSVDEFQTMLSAAIRGRRPANVQ